MANTNGFTFNGQHSAGFFIVNAKERQIAPPIAPKLLTVPGRAGAWDYGYELGVREIPVQVTLLANSPQEYRDLVRDVAAWLLPDDRKPKQLVFDDEPDKYYLARLTGDTVLSELVTFGTATLTFLCADPYARSIVDSTELTWGSEAITFQARYTMGLTGTSDVKLVQYPQTITVSNAGMNTRPTFIITGSASTLTINANGKSFTLPSFTNKSWYIDGERYFVFQVELTEYDQYFLAPNFPAELPSNWTEISKMNDFSGDFLELLPGDNDVRIDGSGLNFNLTVKFPFKYL